MTDYITIDNRYPANNNVRLYLGISPSIITNNREIYIITSKDGTPLELSSKNNKPVVVGILDDEKYSKMHEMSRRVFDINGISPTIHTAKGGNQEIKILIPNRSVSENGGGRTVEHTVSDISPTIRATHYKSGDNQPKVLEPDGMRIRKLTPLECIRLMDFDTEDYHKLKQAGVSNSRVYEAAGDSIVVNVLVKILENLLPQKQEIEL